ncbi:C45 family autoproteolytic acyltransferase/hydolase [uncultured Clostridium sp.]|uniref:C45 family autoproteolytic acyltransferase/hydolase n=1 Tax=uncultured Clostridium sp. TaxID=59620 RepID=UPI0028E8A75D|nr:C45 family autoproteolytic acyltransferase/hydolase [uncultured Clostridium sp.]
MGNKIKFIEAKGNPYERGWISGVGLKEAINSSIKNYVHLLNNEDLMKKSAYIKEITKERFSDYILEIEGRAEGAGVDKDLYFLMMCAELLNEGVGCTTLVCKRKDGTILLGHNEDDSYNPGNSALTKCWNDKEWFVTYDYCNMPFGNAFSFNNYGIIKTINYCYSEEVSITGIPRYFLQRYISEAKSLEDFVNRCNIENRGSGFHAVALDINKNQCISVEVTHKDISVKEIDDYYVHTNHYIHQSISNREKITGEGSTSPFRLEKGKELLKKKINEKGNEILSEDFVNILDYRGKNYEDSILGIENEPNFTCSRIVFDTRISDKVLLQLFHTKEKHYQNYEDFNI